LYLCLWICFGCYPPRASTCIQQPPFIRRGLVISSLKDWATGFLLKQGKKTVTFKPAHNTLRSKLFGGLNSRRVPSNLRRQPTENNTPFSTNLRSVDKVSIHGVRGKLSPKCYCSDYFLSSHFQDDRRQKAHPDRQEADQEVQSVRTSFRSLLRFEPRLREGI